MEEFQIVVEIDRPVDAVWAALLNYERFPDWNPGVTEVRRVPSPPEVGNTVVYMGKFLGRSYESVAECTEFVAHKTFASRSTSGPFHLEIQNILEQVNGGTKLTSTYRGESRGFFKLAEPVVVRLTKKQFETATENFKALLEANEL